MSPRSYVNRAACTPRAVRRRASDLRLRARIRNPFLRPGARGLRPPPARVVTLEHTAPRGRLICVSLRGQWSSERYGLGPDIVWGSIALGSVRMVSPLLYFRAREYWWTKSCPPKSPPKTGWAGR